MKVGIGCSERANRLRGQRFVVLLDVNKMAEVENQGFGQSMCGIFEELLSELKGGILLVQKSSHKLHCICRVFHEQSCVHYPIKNVPQGLVVKHCGVAGAEVTSDKRRLTQVHADVRRDSNSSIKHGVGISAVLDDVLEPEVPVSGFLEVTRQQIGGHSLHLRGDNAGRYSALPVRHCHVVQSHFAWRQCIEDSLGNVRSEGDLVVWCLVTFKLLHRINHSGNSLLNLGCSIVAILAKNIGGKCGTVVPLIFIILLLFVFNVDRTRVLFRFEFFFFACDDVVAI